MNVDSERLSVYLQSIRHETDEFLKALRKEAEGSHVPIIREDMEDLMKLLLKLTKPKRVLEVGTAVGYSAIFMAKNLPEEAEMITIENDEPRAAKARENILKAGLDKKITLMEGDAGTILKELSGTFDFIFMDAAKAQYVVWLPDVLAHLSEGGLLVTDNVLQEGDILESRFAVTRRNRTIHSRMREYLYELKNTDGLTTTILNVGDGAALTVNCLH